MANGSIEKNSIRFSVSLTLVIFLIWAQSSFSMDCGPTLSGIQSTVAKVDEGLSAKAQQRIVEVEHRDQTGKTFGFRFSQIGWPTLPSDFPSEILSEIFKEGAQVTEVAAGSGSFLRLLDQERVSRRISDMTFVGTDILPPAVGLGSNLSLIPDDLFASKLAPETSDGVFAIYSPLQAPLPASFVQSALTAMANRAKPGGFVLIFPLARENGPVAEEVARVQGLQLRWSKDLYPERNHGPALIFQKPK